MNKSFDNWVNKFEKRIENRGDAYQSLISNELYKSISIKLKDGFKSIISLTEEPFLYIRIGVDEEYNRVKDLFMDFDLEGGDYFKFFKYDEHFTNLVNLKDISELKVITESGKEYNITKFWTNRIINNVISMLKVGKYIDYGLPLDDNLKNLIDKAIQVDKNWDDFKNDHMSKYTPTEDFYEDYVKDRKKVWGDIFRYADKIGNKKLVEIASKEATFDI